MFTRTVLFYNGSASGGRRGWVQAVIGMQLTGLMLNRCDRASPASCWMRNTTKERAGAGYTPQRPFFFNLVSHDDAAKTKNNTPPTFLLNSITEQMEEMANRLQRASSV